MGVPAQKDIMANPKTGGPEAARTARLGTIQWKANNGLALGSCVSSIVSQATITMMANSNDLVYYRYLKWGFLALVFFILRQRRARYAQNGAAQKGKTLNSEG